MNIMDFVCWSFVAVSVLMYGCLIHDWRFYNRRFKLVVLIHLVLFAVICYKLATVEPRTTQATYKVVSV